MCEYIGFLQRDQSSFEAVLWNLRISTDDDGVRCCELFCFWREKKSVPQSEVGSFLLVGSSFPFLLWAGANSVTLPSGSRTLSHSVAKPLADDFG